MNPNFYTKHKSTINTTIDKGKVKYVASAGKGTDTVVQCYYIDGKDARISAYVMKNKKSKVVYKYILKVMIISGTKNQPSVSSARDTSKYAQRIFEVLDAKYSEQMARTQLKHEWRNPAFVHKR